MQEVKDAVIVSIITVTDRKIGERLKEKFGDAPIILSKLEIFDDPAELDADLADAFRGAFTATFVGGTAEDEDDDKDEPFESVMVEDLK